MITKSIGVIRNVIKKRDDIKKMIQSIISADNSLVITIQDNKMRVAGHVEDDAMTLFMLGRAIGQCVEQRVSEDHLVDVSEYLLQPNIVATTYLEAKGIL